MKKLLNYNLVFFMLLFLFVPGFLALANLFFPNVIPENLSSYYNLAGHQDIPQKKEFSLINLTSHDFQKYIDLKLTNQLPLRSLLIRSNNQIYYTLFHKSYTGIIIGDSDWLLGSEYIEKYCDHQYSKQALVTWADKLKQLSRFFEARGQTFIYLITPSKPEYLPERIPKRFHCKHDAIAHEAYLEKLLNDRHVHTINEVTNMAIATKQYGTLMFSNGDCHWNELGSMIGANSVIDAINQAGRLHIDPIQFKYEITNFPRGRDTAILDMLNILNPHRAFSVPAVSYVSQKNPSPRYSAVFIGGSFIDGMGDAFVTLNTFKTMLTYNYFNGAIYDYSEGHLQIIPSPDINSETIIAPILNANIVVLEENPSRTNSTHGNLFYQVMLKHAKDYASPATFNPDNELALVNQIERLTRKEMSQKNIAGNWAVDGKPAKIVFNGKTITIINELHAESSASIEDQQILYAKDWQVKATLSLDEKILKWNNGSMWMRS